ncbi:uncharacterized protein LOC120676045 [Panicum virgatum]|uniref:uncharacterized protein LOC120676045 n=1 Tax=Panicum virgatum TaxID=38727 RepID=UPI0019D58A46|nr:uncharacterized protein LOC120676045 [Panicum virgatum]XP_039813196.1 uncharacterized protein LOC120676045 [Panicum virgatum]
MACYSNKRCKWKVVSVCHLFSSHVLPRLQIQPGIRRMRKNESGSPVFHPQSEFHLVLYHDLYSMSLAFLYFLLQPIINYLFLPYSSMILLVPGFKFMISVCWSN